MQTDCLMGFTVNLLSCPLIYNLRAMEIERMSQVHICFAIKMFILIMKLREISIMINDTVLGTDKGMLKAK